jgi:uncharacterized protein YlxW (UPF0749 family)
MTETPDQNPAGPPREPRPGAPTEPPTEPPAEPPAEPSAAPRTDSSAERRTEPTDEPTREPSTEAVAASSTEPSAGQPEEQAEARPDQPDDLPGQQAEEQAEARPDQQPDQQPDEQSDQQSEQPADAQVDAQADAQVVPVVANQGEGGPDAVWRRISEGIRPSRGQAIVGVVLGLVAFLAVVQVRQNLADDGYANARREDLIEILDGLGQSTRRLEAEIAELEARKSQLSSGADRAENARAQAEQQIKVLGILAGTLPAQGPGVRITLTDPNGKVESGNLLDAIEELRDAGAEAIQINGKVRVVASTDFTDDPPGIRVDGEKVQAPYVIEAIGDSHNLSGAATFPGGLVSEVTGPQINGRAEVKEIQTLHITALHTPQEHRYARPAASPTK